ncbi:MAG: T9SS type A sorting domain-containing protein [Bacteroidota bacterium]
MKNYFMLFFFLLIGWTGLVAQITPGGNNCGINFSYDNAGNRIKRFVCLGSMELQFRETTQTEQLGKSLDLQAMLLDAGYSQELETEIEQLESLLSHTNDLDLQKTEKAEPLALTDRNFANLSDMVVFPNPAMTSFSIRADGLNPESTLSIISLDGRILRQQILGDGRDIDVSLLAKGAYVLVLVDENQRRVSLLVKSN